MQIEKNLSLSKLSGILAGLRSNDAETIRESLDEACDLEILINNDRQWESERHSEVRLAIIKSMVELLGKEGMYGEAYNAERAHAFLIGNDDPVDEGVNYQPAINALLSGIDDRSDHHFTSSTNTLLKLASEAPLDLDDTTEFQEDLYRNLEELADRYESHTTRAELAVKIRKQLADHQMETTKEEQDEMGTGIDTFLVQQDRLLDDMLNDDSMERLANLDLPPPSDFGARWYNSMAESDIDEE